MAQERDCRIIRPIGNDDYALRSCLCCGKLFNSQSKGNRQCVGCKQNNEDASGLPQIWQECTPVPTTITQKTKHGIKTGFGYRPRRLQIRKKKRLNDRYTIPEG